MPCPVCGSENKRPTIMNYTANRHNLSFCKTILQIVLSAKRFAKPFYLKIRKAQIMPVSSI